MCKVSTSELKKFFSNLEGRNLPGIYLITRKSDNKPYVGQTSCPIEDRLIQHINNDKIDSESTGIDAEIARLGYDKFNYNILMPLPDATTEQLWFLEGLCIDKYDSKNKGFNKTEGNHKGKFDLVEYRRKFVPKTEVMKRIEKHFNLDFFNKRVLLIRNYSDDFIGYLKYKNCEVVKINKFTTNDIEFLTYFYEEFSELSKKDFDIIISNPPYGKIGVEITHCIIDNINYKEFINLLPANDYRRRKENLYQYVDISSMESVKHGFEDAAVTTHMAKINKKPCYYISADEFEIENYIDPILKKYFYENFKRTHSAIDAYYRDPSIEKLKTYDNVKSINLGGKTVLPKAKNSIPYRYNIDNWTINDFINSNELTSRNTPYLSGNSNFLGGFIIQFNTEEERKNIVNFLYSTLGNAFIQKVIIAMDKDSYKYPSKYLPKVDWAKEWTVEKILANYGYTEDEIKEVMDDLVNYKGMEA